MEQEDQLKAEVKKAKEELIDLKNQKKLGLISEEEYFIKKESIEELLNELNAALHPDKKTKVKNKKKDKKIEEEADDGKRFDLEKEMALLLEQYQVEVEDPIITIFIKISNNKIEKIHLSIKDKANPILKLDKNLLYLGDPFEYNESLSKWKQGIPIYFIEIIREFERYILDMLGTDFKPDFDTESERTHVLLKAREFLDAKNNAKASYLYDYAAELSMILGETGVADAYRKKIHKLQMHMKGEFIL